MSDSCALSPVVEARNIAKAFFEGDRERHVFKNLSARFNAAETTVIIGRSGTGKSTLLNLLCGIDLPDAGQVFVDGIDTTGLSDQQRTLYRRKSVGFVFQFFNLIPTLTVGENLLLPLELLGLEKSASLQTVERLLDAVGLGTRQKSFPDTLSGGEQQRIAIARALVHEPALVLADEPTGNLDAESGREVLDLLGQMTHSAGRTLIVVSHSDEVVEVADRVLRLVDGQLVDQT